MIMLMAEITFMFVSLCDQSSSVNFLEIADCVSYSLFNLQSIGSARDFVHRVSRAKCCCVHCIYSAKSNSSSSLE